MTFDESRERMVHEQLKARGIGDPRVLDAFRRVPRHLFVPAELQREAYSDHPLPIGEGQTISQPYIVALMLSALRLQGHERVLEVGTGSGYVAALLSELALEVFSVERLPALLRSASERLQRLGFLNVHLHPGNGSLGHPERQPYDALIVSAAAPDIPQPLLDQLADRGRMVLPLGAQEQQVLVRVEKHGTNIIRQELAGCIFVPLMGRFGWTPGPSSNPV